MLWDDKTRAEKVLEHMIRITPAKVKGAHDAQMVIVSGKAYIVYEANDIQPGENPSWPYNYAAMSIVDINNMRILSSGAFAKSASKFENAQLKTGSCFVPRVLQKDERTLRVFFASTEPGVRQTETWYIDYNLETQAFCNRIHRLMLETKLGIFPMEPKYFYAQAKLEGFSKAEKDDGMYLFDIGKKFDGKQYVALNNFPGQQNALGIFNKAMDTVSVLGNYNEPQCEGLSESAIQRTPDGKWLAIVRNDWNNKNYRFSYSVDGHCWSPAEEWPLVQNGSNSKPIFEQFGGVYYLGWQEKPDRTRFNIDLSADLIHWKRAYSFNDAQFSLQYPSLYAYNGIIYICATHGKVGPSGDFRDAIMFGKLTSIEDGQRILNDL